MRKISLRDLGIPEDSPFRAWQTEGEDEWLALRDEGVGGSDVGSIMGHVPWRPPYKLWMQKTGKAAPDDLSGNQRVEWGVRLEGIVRGKFIDEHPDLEVVSRPDVSFQSIARPWAKANLDGIIRDASGRLGVLEIKTADYTMRDVWDDGVPASYVDQVTHYLSVTGWGYAYVAVLIGGNDYREFRMDRDDEDVAAIESNVDYFWNEHVVKDVMPAFVGSDAESELLFETHGMGNDSCAEIEDRATFDGLVLEYRAECDAVSEHEARKKIAANRIKDIIGDNSKAMTDVYSVSWPRFGKSCFDLKRFRAEHPDLADQYTYTRQQDGGIRVRELRQAHQGRVSA